MHIMTKEEFINRAYKDMQEKKKGKDKEYDYYVAGAIERMQRDSRGWKRKYKGERRMG